MPYDVLIPPHYSDEKRVRVREVAEWLGISPITVYRWAKEGKLPQPRSLSPRVHIFRVGDLREAFAALELERDPRDKELA